MGLLHCPLCIGLAVMSALRFSAHAVLAFQLVRQRFERFSSHRSIDGNPDASVTLTFSGHCSETTQAVAAL